MEHFAPGVVFFVGKVPITNTLLNILFVDLLIIGGVLLIKKKLSLVPKGIQNLMEMVIDLFYKLTETVADTRASYIFPYFMSFFIFILLVNWSGLLPGVGTIGFFRNDEFTPIFRGGTSDINTTIALAIVSVFATHILSIRLTGVKDYLTRYISLNPINLFIGILEIISEITKVVSLSFRLFGNIFAGEVVLATISGIFAFLVPLPFLMLEIIVGFVQALVFSMLTMAFMAILTTSHHTHEDNKNYTRG